MLLFFMKREREREPNFSCKDGWQLINMDSKINKFILLPFSSLTSSIKIQGLNKGNSQIAQFMQLCSLKIFSYKLNDTVANANLRLSTSPVSQKGFDEFLNNNQCHYLDLSMYLTAILWINHPIKPIDKKKKKKRANSRTRKTHSISPFWNKKKVPFVTSSCPTMYWAMR